MEWDFFFRQLEAGINIVILKTGVNLKVQKN